MKRKLKYLYYKMASILLGKSALDYSGRGCRYKIARLLSGRSSAVLLIIKGKVSGVGYNRWLRSNARDHKVNGWIRRRNKHTVEVLLVGKLKRVDAVVDLVKSSRFTGIDQINERWLVKEGAKGLPAIAKPIGKRKDGGEKFVITFAGDTSLGDYYLKKPGLEKEYKRLQSNPISFFEKIMPLTKGSSFLVLNLETVLADDPVSPLEGIKKWMGWDNPGRTLSVLKELGVGAVSLANNHTMDFGPEILNQTRKLLNNAGIQTFGAGGSLKEAAKPIKIRCRGKNSTKNIYVFGAMRVKWKKRFREDYNYYATENSPGINIFGTERICNSIAKLRKKEPDALIIVFPHWQGYDYKWAPKKVREISGKLLCKGANFVFGHGSHTIQQLESEGLGVAACSIGNFVFNSKGRFKEKDALPFSFIVRLELCNNDRDWGLKVKLYPIISDNLSQGFQPYPVSKQEFYWLMTSLKYRTAYPEKFLEQFKLCRDDKGWHILIGDLDNKTLTYELPSAEESYKWLLRGNFSGINFDNKDIVHEHIKQLERLHDEVDSKFASYYMSLFRSKLFRPNNLEGEQFYEKLCKVLKREHVTHNFLRRLERRKLRVEQAISFRDIMIENSSKRRLGCPEYAWLLDEKINGYKFADRIGLRRPKSNLKTYALSEIQEQNGPVVIKPTHRSGSKGVYLVFNKDAIFSARKRVYLNSWLEFKDDACGYSEARWMVEELISGDKSSNTIASDLKFYCFYGEVVLILEYNRAKPKEYCFWNMDMEIVETGKYKGMSVPGRPGFDNGDLSMVSDVSLEIPAPFIRLDMLKGWEGLVFGEATPRPGDFQLFSKEYDRKLGEAYRRAESRILRDLLNGKRFEAFTSVFEV